MFETIEEAFNHTKRILIAGPCCSYVQFKSVYSGDNTDYANMDILLEVYSVNKVEERTCIFEGSFLPSTNYFLDNNLGDATYVFVLTLTYIPDGIEEEITLTEELEICLDCCLDKREDLASILTRKMSSISCKIQDFKAIGKKVFDLESTYFKLSNLYYLLNDKNCRGLIDLSCEEINKIDCIIKKIN